MKQKLSASFCGVSHWIFLLALLLVAACSGDDAPTSRLPELSISSASGVTTTQATLEGYVAANGSNISECGFLVNTERGVLEKSGLDTGSKRVASRSSDSSVKLQVSNLSANTTYYYCLYVLSGNTPIKSTIQSFRTAEIGAPAFSDVELVGDAGDTELTVRCRVKSDGGQAMQTLRFEYKQASESVFVKNVKVDKYDEGSTDNTFTGTITGLDPDTEYHIQASGSNGVKEATSAILAVKTVSKTRPTVSIYEIPDNNIGANYISVSGRIENTGASSITERGFLIGTVSDPEVGTEGIMKVDVMAATNEFSATIEGLAPATTYYVRAFAANNPYGSKTQYGYSEVKTVTTKDLSTPSFSALTEQLVGTSLKVACTIKDNGVRILEKGFCYSKTNQRPEADNTANTIKAEEAMEATFPIEENTTYYIRAYVKFNLTGKEETLYSETHTSQKHTFVRPLITETSSSDVSYTSAKLKAVLVDNGITINEKGFFWGKTDKPDATLLVKGNEFEATLSDLQAGTTYYFQPYVKITLAGKVETIKGESVKSFTTLTMPKPKLEAVTAKQSNNVLQLSCPVSAEGVDVTESGFCWSLGNSEPNVNDNICVQGSISGGYLTGSMNVEETKTYYIRAYIKYSAAGQSDVAYSSAKRVDTEAFARPTFSDLKHSLVTQTSAKLSVIVSNNGLTITEKGFVWGTTSDPTTQITVTTDAFEASLTALHPNTKYYYKAYVVYKWGNKSETVYSAEQSFTTLDIVKPTLETLTAKQSNNVLQLSCPVSTEGVTVTESGFCWSLSNANPDVNTTCVKGSISGGNLTASMDVEEKKTYYIRAYIKYTSSGQSGVEYSSAKRVDTEAFARPTFSDLKHSLVTQTSAKLSVIVSNNGATITEKGFVWGTSSNPTTQVQVTTDAVETALTGLLPKTKYYYKAYVVYKWGNKSETVYSAEQSFTTLDIVKPTLEALTAKQSNNVLQLSCTVSTEGVTVSESGFCWSQGTSEPNVNENTCVKGSISGGNLTASMNVEEKKTYYIRAYIKYTSSGQSGVEYSSAKRVDTEAFARPTFSDLKHSLVTQTSAKLSVIVSNNGATITEKGFVWGTSSNPTTQVQVTTDAVETALTGLHPNTKYYYKAYAVYKLGDKSETVYSAEQNFTTQNIAKPEFASVTTKQSNNVLQLSCPVSIEGVNMTESGFCWSRSNTNPDVNNNTCVKGSISDGYLTASMNVEENKTYYIRAYIKYSAAGISEVAYSSAKRVDTEAFAKPTFSDVKHSNVTQSSALLSALIATNGVTVTEKGFVWGTSSNPTTQVKVTTDEFETSLTGLHANTTYYYKAYAIYKLGEKTATAYSDVYNFTTPSIRGAVLTNPKVSDLSFTTATVTSSITDKGDGEVTKKGFCWKEGTATPTIENCTGSKELAADVDFKHVVTGLTHGKKYTVRAYVVTQGIGQTVVSYSNSANFTTVTMTLAQVATPKVAEVTQSQFKVSASVTNPGNTDVTEVGFCWSDQDVKPAEMAHKVKATQEEFVLTVSEGLKSGGTYYVYAYAVNGAGTAYSGKCTVTLKSIPGQGDNPYPGKE